MYLIINKINKVIDYRSKNHKPEQCHNKRKREKVLLRKIHKHKLFNNKKK
jgi:large-conductance mechanosensitive channel